MNKSIITMANKQAEEVQIKAEALQSAIFNSAHLSSIDIRIKE